MKIHPADWAAIVQLSQFQSGFLARTSHELRSPLSSLMSLHQLILNDLCDTPEEERDCIRQAYEAANRLLKMLELVTYISKLESGLSPLEIESISLFSLLEDVKFLTQVQAKNRNVILHIEVPTEEPENVPFTSDYRLLRQVLVCLVESSILSLSPGTIKLWCEPNSPAGYLCINLATTPALSVWQELNNFSTPNFVNSAFDPKHYLENLQFVDPQGTQKVPEALSFFSLEYSLMISQILLERINGQLQLIESKSIQSKCIESKLVESNPEDQPFYLQCQVRPIVVSNF